VAADVVGVAMVIGATDDAPAVRFDGVPFRRHRHT